MSIPFGLCLHSLSLKLGFSHEPFTGSALVSFYSKIRLPGDVLKVFDDIPGRDEFCYSAAIVGLAQNSWLIDALLLFSDMRCSGIKTTMYSISGALGAVAQLAALEQCTMIHAHAVVTGFDGNVIVGSALIDGYGKAGVISDARRMFDENLPMMNTVGWNMIMSGYSQQGDTSSVMELFRTMEDSGFVPDDYSFLAILSSCCNAGLADAAEKWICKMKSQYGLEPRLEHYTCLISAMARAGRVAEAEKIALVMPFKPDAAVWRSLLMASRYDGCTDTVWRIARQLLELDPNDDSAYVIAANVLFMSGRWDEVAKVRKEMKDCGVRKESGRSWIEARGEVHVFLAGDKRHRRRTEIYMKLMELMEGIEKLGYVPISEEILHEIRGEKEMREALWSHSEKLALAFGLLEGVTPPAKALRIVKNLRICRDCHDAFKYISKSVEREIIVRDVNRYHRFSNGVCTCGGVW